MISLSALPYDDLLDVIVLHHEACGAVVEIDEAGSPDLESPCSE